MVGGVVVVVMVRGDGEKWWMGDGVLGWWDGYGRL